MNDMVNIHKIIILVQAFLNACKDLHYTCKGYARHIFADEIAPDSLYDTIDSIKENVILATGSPLPSAKVYATATAVATPEVAFTDHGNLMNLSTLVTKILEITNATDVNCRAANVLLDNIADTFAKAKALLIIEMKGTPLTEENEVLFNVEEALDEAMKILHDHKAATEKEVDRKVIKAIYPDGEKVAKRVLDYEAQNVLVAEGSALDRVSKKLGLE